MFRKNDFSVDSDVYTKLNWSEFPRKTAQLEIFGKQDSFYLQNMAIQADRGTLPDLTWKFPQVWRTNVFQRSKRVQHRIVFRNRSNIDGDMPITRQSENSLDSQQSLKRLSAILPRITGGGVAFFCTNFPRIDRPEDSGKTTSNWPRCGWEMNETSDRPTKAC